MPINTENTVRSIDFGYEHAGQDGVTYEYKLKFMQSELGPTIQISNDPYDPVLLPASMFIEVSEFLISERVMNPTKLIVPAKKTTLQTPTIQKKTGNPSLIGSPKTANAVTTEEAEEAISFMERAAEEVFNSIDVPPADEQAEKPKITDAMKEARANALAKAKPEAKKIKKRDE